MNSCAVIVLLLLAAPLDEAARIFGVESFSLNSLSHFKSAPASNYPSVEDMIPENAFLELKDGFSRRANLEKYPGSEDNLKPDLSAKSKASDQRSNELLHKILPTLEYDVVDRELGESVAPFQPLGHSPGIGHKN